MAKAGVVSARLSDRWREAAPLAYIDFFRAEPAARIQMVKAGIGARVMKRLVSDLDVDQKVFFPALNISIATVNRKALRNEALAPDEGERVVGVAKLVGQLEAIVEESGDPVGFDAKAWISRWLLEPLPALGNRRPLDLLDTMEGQTMVSNALAQVQSGAYA